MFHHARIRNWLDGVSALFLLILLCPSAVLAQGPAERSIEEIKSEALARAENGMYPAIGLDPADLREAFAAIKTKDKDEWAAAFIAVADRYMAEGRALEPSEPAKANADYVRAWQLYSFGRFPVPASPGKKRAYAKALAAFLAHAKFYDPPLEVVHIPFEKGEIVGYLRLPKNVQLPVPVVLLINGVDSRKENLTENFAGILASGVGTLAVDSPGTGQAPIAASETAARMFSRALDYLEARPEVDRARLAVHGVSWGAYWAIKLSVLERSRLRAVSAQSPAVHHYFQRDFLMNSLLGNREYLFDQVPALMSMYDGVQTVDELAAFAPRMSLLTQDLLSQPTAPMLIVAGARDTQIPLADLQLLLVSGVTPKEAWINPEGGHLGRQVKVWPDPIILKQIVIPWLLRHLQAAN